MSTSVQWHEFDRAVYDEDADVLYLSVGDPRRALGEETPEGYVALYDARTGELCGMTLIGVSVDEEMRT